MTEQSQRRVQARGGRWFGIGIERPKIASNLGTLWRSAVCFDAALLFTIGNRYHPQASDTVKSWRHTPYVPYPDIESFSAARPMDTPIIGVEIVDGAVPLETFPHPRRALYLLGPEDGSLSPEALALCSTVVHIDTRYCLNLASAGTVLMYDRQSKEAAKIRERENAARVA